MAWEERLGNSLSTRTQGVVTRVLTSIVLEKIQEIHGQDVDSFPHRGMSRKCLNTSPNRSHVLWFSMVGRPSGDCMSAHHALVSH